MTESQRLKRGDYVRVRLAGREDDWVNGFVVLASETDPSSVMIMFHGAVRTSGGFVMNGLPLRVDYDAETVTTLWGDDYELEVGDARA